MRLRQRRFLSGYDYDFDNLGKTMVAIGFFLVIAWIALFITYFSVFTGGDEEARVRYQIQEFVNSPESDTERMTIANSILTLYSVGATSLIDDGSDSDFSNDQIVAELEKTAETGEQIALDTTYVGLSVFASYWLWPAILVTVLVLTGSLFGWYLYCSREARHFVSDVRKRNPLTWLFILVTLFPFGFVAYPISYVRLRAFRNRPNLATTTNYNDEPVRRTIENFVSNPEAAQAWYINYRVNGLENQREHQITTVESDIRSYEENIETHGALLEENQRNRQLAKQRLKALKTTPPVPKTQTEQEATEEFKKLSKLHGVTGIRTENSRTLALKVEVRVPYKDKLYDFGDWQIFLSDDGLSSRVLRSAVIPGMERTYPDYDYGSGRFCFEGTEYIVHNLLREGRIYEAASLSVGALHRVNPGDVYRIPEVFKEMAT